MSEYRIQGSSHFSWEFWKHCSFSSVSGAAIEKSNTILILDPLTANSFFPSGRFQNNICFQYSEISKWDALVWLYSHLWCWDTMKPFSLEAQILQFWKIFWKCFFEDSLLFIFYFPLSSHYHFLAVIFPLTYPLNLPLMLHITRFLHSPLCLVRVSYHPSQGHSLSLHKDFSFCYTVTFSNTTSVIYNPW